MNGGDTGRLQPKQGEVILSGVLERIIYFNEENHYCIGELKTGKEGKTITVTGTLPGVQCGETLELAGQWTHNPRYGEQFKIRAYRSTLPSSVYGIRKYLGSGLVPGIGKVYANKIVDQFGVDTLKVISEQSARLREVAGIGKQRAKAIKKSWDDQQAVREVMMFLQTYGVSVAQCLRLVREYGNSARQILQNDPYRVAREITGIGFKTADRIAINLGFANDSRERLDAGILYALQTLEDNGHTGYPLDELQGHAAELLEADAEKIGSRMQALVQDKSIILSTGSDLLQLPATEYAENKIAESIGRLLTQPSGLPPIKTALAVEWAQERAGFEFAPEQAQAVSMAVEEKLSIITGGPGTGKTTILRAVVDILSAKKTRILLASPTGRAAQRMAEAAGIPAQTIHRLLNYDPAEGRFTVNEESPLKADAVIVDEASMLDTRLAAALFRAIPAAAHLILVGDINQLPSVGAGNVLKDLIESGCVKVVRLERIFRQEEQSPIVHLAWNILRGNAAPPSPEALDQQNDLQFIKATSPEDCIEAVIHICRDFIPRHTGYDPVMDVQVLAPMHRGVAGITNLNAELQKALNPKASGLRAGGTFFHVGDKVIQTRNNYEKNIFNGDMGKVTAINLEAGTLAADFDGTEIDFERLELSDLQPAYATSVHKSQGSEFPAVIIPILKQHYMMLQRNLLYTAVTRGKEKVFLVGDPAAYAMAVRNKESGERKTDLKRKIKTVVNEGGLP